MNNQNLIPVFEGKISNSETLFCDARQLHEFLQVKTRYSQWLKERITEYGFQENQDFVIASEISEAKKSGRGGHNRIEYHITLDMAKELAMVERNEKGRAIRRYFIHCEKQLKENTASMEQWIFSYQIANELGSKVAHEAFKKFITTDEYTLKSRWIISLKAENKTFVPHIVPIDDQVQIGTLEDLANRIENNTMLLRGNKKEVLSNLAISCLKRISTI